MFIAGISSIDGRSGAKRQLKCQHYSSVYQKSSV